MNQKQQQWNFPLINGIFTLKFTILTNGFFLKKKSVGDFILFFFFLILIKVNSLTLSR